MKTLRHGDKEVVRFGTPSGVIGIVATSIPREAFKGWADELEARALELDRLEAERLARPAKSPKPKR